MTIEEHYGSDTASDAFAKYWRDGYALFPKLFSDAEIDDLLIRAMLHRGDDRLEQEQRGPRGTIIHWSAAVDPVLDGIRSSDRLFDIVSRALGTGDVRQYSQQICSRDPGSGGPTRWHRDENALALRFTAPRTSSVALALYLDDVLSLDQGATLFVPGSHEWDPATPVDNAAYGRCEAILPRRGMVGLWNAGTIHGSCPNRTSRDRRSLMHGYVRADASDDAADLWTWREGRSLSYGEGLAAG